MFGVEGEWLWTGIKGGQTASVAAAGFSQTTTLDSRMDWLAIASARAGFVVGDSCCSMARAVWRSRRSDIHTARSRTSAQTAATFAANAKAVHTGFVVGAAPSMRWAETGRPGSNTTTSGMAGQGITVTGTATFNAPPQVGTINYANLFDKMQQDLQLIKFGANYHFNRRRWWRNTDRNACGIPPNGRP